MDKPPEHKAPRIAALVVAAGRGTRAGLGGPKQYRVLAGQTVLARSILALLAEPAITSLRCVIHKDDAAAYESVRAELPDAALDRLGPPVIGGAERQDSVRLGLEALAGDAPDLVLVHDAARPFASRELVGRSIAAGLAHGAAIPGVAVINTLKQVDAEGRIVATLDRASARAVQTPQAFRFADLLAAHRAALAAGRSDFTDDAAVMELCGHAVHVFPGDEANVKLTTMDDMTSAEVRLSRPRETRTGLGYDVHAFGPGDHVMVGGVRIAHDRGVLAHSDGDVVLHALTDAILGALADGDIGSHFPPSDPQWKGKSSDHFLDHAMTLLRQREGRLIHCDVVVVCEEPRIGPHREAMRQRIAAICGISLDRVAIKATTSERLGFTGRREGIAAQAVATMTLPESAP
jgi:2-C-methyl-D-erythritol 4-phosphate cytidylyltransferase/2-C-methyl-D-erythritol 2,4-cyclodiphosphate synthase